MLTDVTVHGLIRERRSPLAFSGAQVTGGELQALLEAARWAASSYNEQPWRFVIGDRHRNLEAFDRVLSTLMPGNAIWAGKAPVLMVVVAKTTFSHNGAPNRHARYDTGAAVAQLSLEATALGLGVHQMGGFDPEKARTALNIPDGFEAVAVLAIGRPGDASELSRDLQARDSTARSRRPLDELVFDGVWGN